MQSENSDGTYRVALPLPAALRGTGDSGAAMDAERTTETTTERSDVNPAAPCTAVYYLARAVRRHAVHPRQHFVAAHRVKTARRRCLSPVAFPMLVSACDAHRTLLAEQFYRSHRTHPARGRPVLMLAHRGGRGATKVASAMLLSLGALAQTSEGFVALAAGRVTKMAWQENSDGLLSYSDGDDTLTDWSTKTGFVRRAVSNVSDLGPRSAAPPSGIAFGAAKYAVVCGSDFGAVYLDMATGNVAADRAWANPFTHCDFSIGGERAALLDQAQEELQFVDPAPDPPAIKTKNVTAGGEFTFLNIRRNGNSALIVTDQNAVEIIYWHAKPNVVISAGHALADVKTAQYCGGIVIAILSNGHMSGSSLVGGGLTFLSQLDETLVGEVAFLKGTPPTPVPVNMGSISRHCEATATASGSNVDVWGPDGDHLAAFDTSPENVTALEISPDASRVAMALTNDTIVVHLITPAEECIEELFDTGLGRWEGSGAWDQAENVMEVSDGDFALLHLPGLMRPSAARFSFASIPSAKSGITFYGVAGTVCATLFDLDAGPNVDMAVGSPNRTAAMPWPTGPDLVDVDLVFSFEAMKVTYYADGLINPIESPLPLDCRGGIDYVDMDAGVLGSFRFGNCSLPVPTLTCFETSTGPASSCVVTFYEDGSSMHAAPLDEVEAISVKAGLVENVTSTSCTCTVGCVSGKVIAGGKVAATFPPDYVGDITLECAFDSVNLTFTGNVTAVNDLPVAVPSTTAVTSVLFPGGQADRTLTAWLPDARPGPAAAVDEVTQQLDLAASACTSSRVGGGESVAVHLVQDPEDQNAVSLRYTLPAWAGGVATVAGDAEYTIECTLADSAGGVATLPSLALTVVFAEPLLWVAGAVAEGSSATIQTSDVSAAAGVALRVTLPGVPLLTSGPTVGVRQSDGPDLAVPPAVMLVTDSTRPRELLALQEMGLVAVVPKDKEGVDLTLQHGDYYVRAPNVETITIVLQPQLFNLSDDERAAVCEPADATLPSPCAFTVRVEGESPTLGVKSTVESVGAAMALTATVTAPAPGAGPGVARVSIVTSLMQCPLDLGEKLDRTLNPLGLEVPGGPHPDENGAVLGAIIILCALFSIVFVLRGVYSRQLAKEYAANVTRLVPEERNCVNPAADPKYVLFKARFGWLLCPFAFLYAGAVTGGVGAIIYNDVLFKIIAAFLVVGFGGGLPWYTWRAARQVEAFSDYRHVPQAKQTLAKSVLWGKKEWGYYEGNLRLTKSYVDLHHLVFDCFRRPWKTFLTYELILTGIAGGLLAWKPTTIEACWTRGLMVTICMAIFTLLLLVCRPYLALYENVMESIIGLVEVAIGVLSLFALEEPVPQDSWAGEVCEVLGMICMYLVFLKFAIDNIIFFLDEYHAWQEVCGGQGSVLRFLLFWFCFVDVLHDKYTYYGTTHDGNDSDQGILLTEFVKTVGGEITVIPPPGEDTNSMGTTLTQPWSSSRSPDADHAYRSNANLALTRGLHASSMPALGRGRERSPSVVSNPPRPRQGTKVFMA